MTDSHTSVEQRLLLSRVDFPRDMADLRSYGWICALHRRMCLGHGILLLFLRLIDRRRHIGHIK